MTVLFTLGQYQFSVDNAAADSLSRTKNYRWQAQNRLGRDPSQQYIGPGKTSIQIQGTIYPHFRGGLGQIDSMKAEAQDGKALDLVDGRGKNLGKFVIKSIQDTEKKFVMDIPRQIDFSLVLESYGQDRSSGSTGTGDGGSGGFFDWLVGSIGRTA
jgi:phage protein U